VLKVQEEFGAGVHFIPGVGPGAMAELAAVAGREPLAGLYTELPSNPLIEMPDLPALAALAAAHDFPLVADDTVATCVNVDAHGHRRSGHDQPDQGVFRGGGCAGRFGGGSARSPWADRPATVALGAGGGGAACSRLDAVVLEKNSRDFPERVRRMSATAATVAAWLAAHPAVARVHFPTLDARQREAFAPLRTGAAATSGPFGMLLSLTLREPGATPGILRPAAASAKDPASAPTTRSPVRTRCSPTTKNSTGPPDAGSAAIWYGCRSGWRNRPILSLVWPRPWTVVPRRSRRLAVAWPKNPNGNNDSLGYHE
jgi:hypothetical protein